MQILIRELSRPERPALEKHFLALGTQDRRLRFGAPLNDFALRAYLRRIDFERDAAFGVFDDALHLVGAAHLARADGYAELGVSVLDGHRGRGVGGALLARAHTRARNWGVRALFMHCLTENSAMMHLASRAWRSSPRRARPTPGCGWRRPTRERTSAKCSSSAWRSSTTRSNKEERG
jgi:GNAT superfamily N-acetyltransferase